MNLFRKLIKSSNLDIANKDLFNSQNLELRLKMLFNVIEYF